MFLQTRLPWKPCPGMEINGPSFPVANGTELPSQQGRILTHVGQGCSWCEME